MAASLAGALVAAAPVSAAPPAPGLLAAYAFDEGSGAVAVDASGNGRHGAIAGGTWTSGRYGGGLSLDGVDDAVALGALGTFYKQGGITLEAWVLKQSASRNDVAVVGTWTSEAGGGPMIWVDHVATRYHLTLKKNLSGYLDSGRNPAAGRWQHVAATYDGSTARFFLDGVEVASQSAKGGAGDSNVWRIGAYGTIAGGFFDGIVDDVRIYGRALAAAEIVSDMNTPVQLADPDAPTTPTGFAVGTRTKTSLTASWGSSSGAVAGYRVYRDGSPVATTTSTSITLTGLTCATVYALQVEAYGPGGSASLPAETTASTALCDGPVGLVAAYRLDEGSGSTAGDTSGAARNGTLVGASWSGGRNGGAVSLNGTSSRVDLPALGTFYRDGLTLSAWVRKQGAKRDTAVVGTWTPSGGGPMIWVDHVAGRYRFTGTGGLNDYLDSGLEPTVGAWEHVAATYDGTTARFYVDGQLSASRAFAGGPGNSDSWRIGAYGATPGGYFDGLVDDVRIYRRALSSDEIRVDMYQPVPAPDTTPPTAPATVSATAGGGSTSLSWSAATDDGRVARYRVHRGVTSGFVPGQANEIAHVEGTAYTDLGLAAGTYYYRIVAEDAAGNVGPPSPEAAATVAPDSTPPTVSITSPSTGSTLAGTATVSATATDDQALAAVEFRLDGATLGPADTTPPYQSTWDTRGDLNGAHELTAVARDAAGNTATAAVSVAIENPVVAAASLRAAYAFDDGEGTLAADASGQGRTATLIGASWVPGRFGSAIATGAGASAALPALGTFYRSGFTLEARAFKQSTSSDVAVLGAWSSSQGGGAMIWVDHVTGRYRLTLGNDFSAYLDSGRTPTVGRWEHLAATYDGTVARFYVDGVETAQRTFTGDPGSATSWRVGAYGSTATGFFDGIVDDVRIYDRALTAAEVAVDAASRVQPERVAPTVTSRTPAAGATDVSVGSSITATFSEEMRASSVAAPALTLTTAAGAAVPTQLTYDAASRTATLAPQAPLEFGTTYRATVAAGAARDLSGNGLAQPVTWTFATEPSPPPVLLVSSPGNRFGGYLAEILRTEGLNAFTTVDTGFLKPALLDRFDLVVLGETPLNSGQVSTLAAWVEAGGKLVAMRPDKQLAPLLGLSDAGATLADAYLRVDTAAPPGAGIASETLQFHGTADRYTLAGATAVARLYTDAATATSSPAVTLRSVGTAGGQAAAFTYDLARSVVYTRQGNPAWTGQDRDGVGGIRSNDLFFGARAGDVAPDWVSTARLGIPQADEQQRLLANLVTHMNRDRTPVPRFWYLPRDLKAALIMTGDDHATGGTAGRFDRQLAASPAGCSVDAWECVRSTSYIYTATPLTNAQAVAYTAQGFEIGVHVAVGSTCAPWQPGTLDSLYYTPQLDAFQAKYAGLAPQVTHRTHCVPWADWSTQAKVERAHGIRLDMNYYHYGADWIGATPGYMTGSGLPMRFADLDGTAIDVYQGHTHANDEAQTVETATRFLLDRALGPEAYYGLFGILVHTDIADAPAAQAIVADARARGVPLISARQALAWLDARNESRFSGFDWSGSTLTFAVDAGTGARGLRAMLPLRSSAGTLTAVRRDGAALPVTTRTIKGVEYGFFDAADGAYTATYG